MMSSAVLEINTDGACRGNPGQAGIGVVVKRDGQVIREISQSIETATNNIAEYTAVIYALQEALMLQARRVLILTDSELLAKQLSGEYKVKNTNLKPLFDQIRHMLPGFEQVKFRHIPREENAHADKLAKQSVKKEQTQAVALEFNFGEESPSSGG